MNARLFRDENVDLATKSNSRPVFANLLAFAEGIQLIGEVKRFFDSISRREMWASRGKNEKTIEDNGRQRTSENQEPQCKRQAHEPTGMKKTDSNCIKRITHFQMDIVTAIARTHIHDA